MVLDAHWLDDHAVTFGTYTGQEVDRFYTPECARTMALRRIQNGYIGTIVVDATTNQQVFPSPDSELHAVDGVPASGTRERGEIGAQPRGSRVKPSG